EAQFTRLLQRGRIPGRGRRPAAVRKSQEEYMKLQLRGVPACNPLCVLLVTLLLCTVGLRLQAQSATNGQATSPQAQKGFNTPQEAAETLIQAAETYDVSALLEIF